MRFLVFAELDSTQLECGRQLQRIAAHAGADQGVTAAPLQSRWLDGGRWAGCPPIAICSGQQSQGRAQMGSSRRRSWQSPPGHLYLSVGLKAPQQAHLTLACGVVVARFVHELLGFAPTLKWPNDLLIDGAKLGGILVEATTVNQQSYVIIGVGINVSSPPPHPGAATLAQWLEPATAAQLEVTALAAELALRLGDLVDQPEIAGMSWLEMAPGGQAYQLMAGLWMQQAEAAAGQPRQFIFDGIDVKGQLRARDGERICTFISSATAPQLPGLTAPAPASAWSIWMEAGHSRLKARLYPGLDPAAIHSEAQAWSIAKIFVREGGGISTSWLRLFEDWVADRARWRGIYLATSGDVASREALQDALQTSGWHVVMIPKKTLRLRVHGAALAQLGFDRICVMEAALAQVYRHGDSRWVMMVSFGTAISVNFCAAGGEYLGGALLPGAGLARRALVGDISSLAHLDEQPDSWPQQAEAAEAGEAFTGMYTAPAITAGIEAQVLGAITYLFERGLEQFGRAGRQPYHQVFVSGGGAGAYMPSLRRWLRKAYEARGQWRSGRLAGVAPEVVEQNCGVMDGMRILAVAAQGGAEAEVHHSTQGLCM